MRAYGSRRPVKIRPMSRPAAAEPVPLYYTGKTLSFGHAADVNLLDSDFFEGRANLEGIYAAFAYSITDNIIGTLRYGYAQPINNQLGTGGNNSDLANLNPIKDYNLFQVDLTWRF